MNNNNEIKLLYSLCKESSRSRTDGEANGGKGNAWKLGVGTAIIFISIYSTYCLAIWYGSRVISEQQTNSNKGRYFIVMMLLLVCSRSFSDPCLWV